MARAGNFAQWLICLEEKRRKVLKDVLQLHKVCKQPYKRRLRANKDWLSRARRQGINVNAWLDALAVEETINGRQVKIAVESDPFEILLMGTYFQTCLSIGGSACSSALANAHDVNKHVIYMRGADGQVIARQLIGVSQDFRLLGYHCYTNLPNENDGDVCAAMARYCGRLARECGLALGDSGAPEELSDLGWYDDGPQEWPEPDRAAWSAALPREAMLRRPPGLASLSYLTGAEWHEVDLANLATPRDCVGR